jgi:hypothetical protein
MPRALTVALALLLAAAPAGASQPPPSYCERNHEQCPRLSATAIRRFTALLAELRATLPRLPGCRWSIVNHVQEEGYGDSPDRALPRELWLTAGCSLPRGGTTGPQIHIEPRFHAADYPADGEILESTPDLYLAAEATGGGRYLTLVVGPRREAWVSARGVMKFESPPTSSNTPELAYASPFVVAMTLSIVAPTPELARTIARELDRERLLAILREEGRRRESQEARAAAERRALAPAARGSDLQAQLARTVKEPAHRAAIKACAERIPSLRQTHLELRVTIGPRGAVKKVVVDAPSELALISRCVSRAVKLWRFPSTGSEFDAAFHLLLQSPQ